MLDYYDPQRQEDEAEHEYCVLEEGVWWFGHGMECRYPGRHHSTESVTYADVLEAVAKVESKPKDSDQ